MTWWLATSASSNLRTSACALRRLAPRAPGQLEVAVGQELAATASPAPAAAAARARRSVPAAPAAFPPAPPPRPPPAAPALPPRRRRARRLPPPPSLYPAAPLFRRCRRPHPPVRCQPRRRRFLRRRPAHRRPRPPARCRPRPPTPYRRAGRPPITSRAGGVSCGAAAPPAVTSALAGPTVGRDDGNVTTGSAQRPGQNTPKYDCEPHARECAVNRGSARKSTDLAFFPLLAAIVIVSFKA